MPGTRTVFEPGERLRRLVVLYADGPPAGGPQSDFLRGLLHDEHIDCLTYADEGPPSHARVKVEPWQLDGAPGWATFTRDPPTRKAAGWTPSFGTVVTPSGQGWRRSRVGHRDLINMATRWGFALDLYDGDDEERAVAVERDIIAGLVGEAVRADLIITARPYLLKRPTPIIEHIATMSEQDALPVVGLYLRQQGEHLVEVSVDGRFKGSHEQGLFWETAVHAAIPSMHRWLTACQRQADAIGDDRYVYLAVSCLQRVARALKLRDQVHAATLIPPDNTSVDDLLEHLDHMLVALAGAFDVCARVTNLALGEFVDARQVNWRNDAFRSRLPAYIGGAVRGGSAGDALLEILALLRNTVHHEALEALAVHRSRSRWVDTLVSLPRDQVPRLHNALGILGGTAVWGVADLDDRRLHADASILVERLVGAASDLFETLLAASPLSRVEAVAWDELPSFPQSPQSDIRPDLLERVRWQLGLSA